MELTPKDAHRKRRTHTYPLSDTAMAKSWNLKPGAGIHMVNQALTLKSAIFSTELKAIWNLQPDPDYGKLSDNVKQNHLQDRMTIKVNKVDQAKQAIMLTL